MIRNTCQVLRTTHRIGIVTCDHLNFTTIYYFIIFVPHDLENNFSLSFSLCTKHSTWFCPRTHTMQVPLSPDVVIVALNNEHDYDNLVRI